MESMKNMQRNSQPGSTVPVASCRVKNGKDGRVAVTARMSFCRRGCLRRPDAYPQRADSEDTAHVVSLKSVLIVDDDASIRTMVRAVLQHDGFEVEEVESGNDAIARIREQQYGVVILDIMMGRGSGQDVLRTLAIERPDVKCVVVISATSQPNLDKIEVSNVKIKLRKPFNIADLLDAVHACTDH
jgi:CheY-like chemotaxis protein